MHDMIKLKFACTRYASSPIALALMLCIFQHFWFERCHQLFFSNQLFSHWLHINPSFSKISWKQLEKILKWMKLIYKKKDTISSAMQFLRSLRFWILCTPKTCTPYTFAWYSIRKRIYQLNHVTSFEKIVSLHHITISREFLIGML